MLRPLTAVLLLAAAARGQGGESGPASSSRGESRGESRGNAKETVTAIVNGDVLTASDRGNFRRGVVLIRGSKIWKIGTGIEIPKDATIIDASGCFVTPGFVAVAGQGILPVSTSGSKEKSEDTYDPFAPEIAMALAAGLTTIYQSSGSASEKGTSGGVIGKCVPGSLQGFLVREPAALLLSYGHGQMAARLATREALEKARKAGDAAAGKKGGETSGGSPDEATRALIDVLEMKLPCRVRASSRAELEGVVALSRDFDLPLVVEGGEEAWLLASEISKARISLVITPRRTFPRPRMDPSDPEAHDPTENGTYGHDPEDCCGGDRLGMDAVMPPPRGEGGSTIELAAILDRAGIRFAITALSGGMSTNGIAGRDMLTLPVEAAFGVRGGLDSETALRSITIQAAAILGVADRIGSLEAGKDADVLILDGHPLDFRTFVETAIVNGRVAYEREKAPFFRHLRHGRRIRPTFPETGPFAR